MVLSAACWAAVALSQEPAEREVIIPDNAKLCIACHGAHDGTGRGVTQGIVEHWWASRHAEFGVGCVDCHRVPQPGEVEDAANPRYMVKTTWDKTTGLKSVEPVLEDGKPVERPDIWKHGGQDLAIDVSPRTCEPCHEQAVREFTASRHSSAAQFIGSIDNYLGRFVEGAPASVNGCESCHGSVVTMGTQDPARQSPTYSADTWPNTGMGRVNADGSWGACSACHSRHEFSSETARRPENCGKCHLGPDHPQKEIFDESKHGVAWRKHEEKMDLAKPGGEWVLGTDYSEAPSCSSCHMGPVAAFETYKKLPLTHDVGARISWTLRPVLSEKPKAVTAADGTVVLPAPEERRNAMEQACRVCHGPTWVGNFYVQYDQAVGLYNDKYAKPATAVYDLLKQQTLVDAVPMNERADFVYYELWHHEGRRARMGAAMMGPDYVHWHGFYDLSKVFYTELLPLAQELADGAGKGEDVRTGIDAILHGPDGKDWDRYHRWMQGLSPEARAELLEMEKQGYGGTPQP